MGLVPDIQPPSTLFAQLPTQVEWAVHMGIPAVILPSVPEGSEIMEYARTLQNLALDAQANNLQLWIKTKLSNESFREYELLHRLCDGLSNIGMMLVMEPTQNVPSTATPPVSEQVVILHKAIGAQLKAICFPTKAFLTNKRGYPTLAKSHQVIFTEVLKRVGRTVRVLLDGPAVHEISGGMGTTKCLPYLQYIQHMRQRPDCVERLDSEPAQMETAYLDSLQRPLQPLKDHLEFSMYETFEKDPVKYIKYQQAVYMALQDKIQAMMASPTSPKVMRIMVAGAGRGPLVLRCLRAFQDLKLSPGTVALKVYAVEKNPSANVYLHSMAAHDDEWKGFVEVIHADARNLTRERLGGSPVDIVVSELLGSFGDNELSPECLDPIFASDCVTPTTVSIPRQYTTFLAPVSSIRLHTDAKAQCQVPHEGAQPLGMQRAMETSYVVRTHAASQTHHEQRCWTFDHPTRLATRERTATLEFLPDPSFGVSCGSGYGGVDLQIGNIVGEGDEATAGPVTLHGLLGTFTAVLYARGSPEQGSVCDISIAPHAFSKNMFSWFPIYFPFREPLYVPAGGSVSVKMWRKVGEGRVWYEWCATVHRKGEIIDATPIHNPKGRSSFVSM